MPGPMVTIEEAELTKLRSDLAAAQELVRLAGHREQNLTLQRDEAVANLAKATTDHAAALAKAKADEAARADAAIAAEVVAWETAAVKVLGGVDSLRAAVVSMGGTTAASAVRKAEEKRKLDKVIADATKRRNELGQ